MKSFKAPLPSISRGELEDFARSVECSIIVACFNEEANIEECVRRVRKVLPRAEILVVHGGTDRTADIVKDLAQADPGIRVICNQPDFGKGHASKVGILAAKYDLQGTIDADLQFFPEDLPALLYPVSVKICCLAHASRFLKKNWSAEAKNPFRDIGNRSLCFLVYLLTGWGVTDLTAGFHAWDRDHIRKVWFDDDRFSFDIELIMRTIVAKAVLQEIPVQYRHRAAGESMHKNNWQVIKAGMEMVKVILSTWFQARVLKRIRAGSFPSVSPRLKREMD